MAEVALELTAYDVSVTALDGEPVRLEDLWASRRVALSFLRHFG